MFFDIHLDIECPKDQAMDHNLLRIQEFVAKESILANPVIGSPDHGCWEDEEHGEVVRLVTFFHELTPQQADNLFEFFELTLSKLTVPVLQCFGTIPSLQALGDCRYSSKFSRMEQRVVEAYITPWPRVILVNRKDDGAWQERCWKRLQDVMLRRWG